jgi:hypothetical protein
MRCIGYLTSQAADDPVSQAYMAALLQGLQKAGWTPSCRDRKCCALASDRFIDRKACELRVDADDRGPIFFDALDVAGFALFLVVNRILALQPLGLNIFQGYRAPALRETPWS